MCCYLCSAQDYKLRKGTVRDNHNLEVRDCCDCGLVYLDKTTHISDSHYQESGMHIENQITMEEWIKQTHDDDVRRIKQHKEAISGKDILDFGCGAGGFLEKAIKIAKNVTGIELEKRVSQFWSGKIQIYDDIKACEIKNKKYDLISLFHVLEHCPDPRQVLKNVAEHLKESGRIIIEVPNSNDALVTFYDNNAFQNFTYWSNHLYYFNSKSLELLARQARLRVCAIQHYQRYPLSNHLYWLSKGLPGGHRIWSYLDSKESKLAYSNCLAALGKTDTLIAYLELEPMQ